jgi:hypothetical protein
MNNAEALPLNLTYPPNPHQAHNVGAAPPAP